MTRLGVTRLSAVLLAGLLSMLPGGPAGAAGGTLTILRTNDSNMYDPQRAGARASYEVILMLADTLVSLDQDMKRIRPGLAKSWTVSPDGLTYTFTLREDVKFCDGKPMTAADVVFSLKRWVAPETKSPNQSRAGDTADIKTTGKYTVAYVLAKPYSELLYQLAYPYAAIVDPDTVTKLGQDFGVRGFNGTGPFCWVKWEPRNQMVLKRHDAYRWGPPVFANAGPAHVEEVIWKVVPEDNTRIAALQTGQADLTYTVPWAAIGQLKADPRVTVTEAPAFGWTGHLGFKVNREQVADPRVRRAMLLAVDQDTMVKSIWFGQALPAYTFVHPTTVDYAKELEGKLVKYNPAVAAKLLDEVGWKKGSDGFRYKDGKKLAPIVYGQDNTGWRMALEAVQGYMREVGIDMQLQLWEPAAAMTKMRTQDYDLYALYAAYPTAGDVLLLYFRSNPNRANWQDPATDQLLDAGKAALTPQARYAAYAKAQERLYDATVWIPLVHERMFVASNKARVTGAKPFGIAGAGLYKGLDIKVVK